MKSASFRGALTSPPKLARTTGFLDKRLRSATGGALAIGGGGSEPEGAKLLRLDVLGTRTAEGCATDSPLGDRCGAESPLGDRCRTMSALGDASGGDSAEEPPRCNRESPLGERTGVLLPEEEAAGGINLESAGDDEAAELLAVAASADAAAAAAAAATSACRSASACLSASCSSSRAWSRSLARCARSAARSSRSAAMLSCSVDSCEALARSSASTASRAPTSCRNFSEAFFSAALDAEISSSRRARDSPSRTETRFSILDLLEHS